jgi:hypothetical protein
MFLCSRITSRPELARTGLKKTPVTGLFPGKAGIGPVRPTFSVGAGTTGLSDTAEPSSAYTLSVSDVFLRMSIKASYGLNQQKMMPN